MDTLGAGTTFAAEVGADSMTMSGARCRRLFLLAIALAMVVLTGCGSDRGAATSVPTPTATVQANESADNSDVTEPIESPITFKAITLKGRGDKVAKFKIPEDSVATATFSHSGSSNFAVTSLDASGGQNDLLVNEIGKYKGTVLFDDNAHSVAFKIEADGGWTAVVKPISSARKWDLSKALTGTGDDVVGVTGKVSGLVSSVVKHSGTSNFAVIVYGDEGRDLLINEIGKYSGEVLMPPGLVLISISADGKWSITVPK
jgi:hypothetical protein